MDDNNGTVGEKLVAKFFDKHFSKVFSFPNPKTKSNAEVADVLVWMNRTVFLIEVKTRDRSKVPVESWAESRIREALVQIKKNYGRIKAREQIFLHNSYYHTQLDCEGVSEVVGIIVLIHDGDIALLPSQTTKEIYNQEIPIHVFSGNALFEMTEEIDTVPDFCYYLKDRFEYLKVSDIPLNKELETLGYYKSQSNRFSNSPIDFDSQSFLETYRVSMVEQIAARNAHNQYSQWLDKLENVFTDQRKPHDECPLGLYFAWELGSMTRRERAYLGEKIEKVQEAFIRGKPFRRFAICNPSTSNWLVFYFAKLSPRQIQDNLERFVRLKLISEVHWNLFDFGVYGFGFQVSITFPSRLLGLSSAIVIGADEIKENYTETDLEDARRIWSPPSSYTIDKIEEFPTD